MGNIKNFNDFVNEKFNGDSKSITIDNIHEYGSKIEDLISNNENLKKGLDFTYANLHDYHSSETVKDIIDAFLNSLNEYIKTRKPLFFRDSAYNWVGSKYELTKDMSFKEIVKLVKEELAIEFPEIKFSVRTTHGTILVEIMDIDFNPFSEEFSKFLESNESWDKWREIDAERYNEQYEKIRKKIKSIIYQYNFDDSDSMRDYHHSRLSGSVRLNEEKMILKFFPNHIETNKSVEWNANYTKKREEANKAARERKGKYKKGTEVIYIHPTDSFIPAGEYPAKVVKSPNGRSRMFSYYDLDVTVDRRIDSKTKEIVVLSKPRTIRLRIFKEDQIKPIE